MPQQGTAHRGCCCSHGTHSLTRLWPCLHSRPQIRDSFEAGSFDNVFGVQEKVEQFVVQVEESVAELPLAVQQEIKGILKKPAEGG